MPDIKEMEAAFMRLNATTDNGIIMPKIYFSQGPRRNGWDGRMWRMEVDGSLLANFFDEGLLRRFLRDSWGILFSEPIPIEHDDREVKNAK